MPGLLCLQEMADEMDSDPLLRKYRAIQAAKQGGPSHLLILCFGPCHCPLDAHVVSCLGLDQTETQLDCKRVYFQQLVMLGGKKDAARLLPLYLGLSQT